MLNYRSTDNAKNGNIILLPIANTITSQVIDVVYITGREALLWANFA